MHRVVLENSKFRRSLALTNYVTKQEDSVPWPLGSFVVDHYP